METRFSHPESQRYRTVAAGDHFQHGILTDNWTDAMDYARRHEDIYCVVVEDRDAKEALYLRHCSTCACCRPRRPEIG